MNYPVFTINQNKPAQSLNAGHFVQNDEVGCCMEFKEYNHLKKDKRNLIKFLSLECGCKKTAQFHPNSDLVADGTNFWNISENLRKIRKK